MIDYGSAESSLEGSHFLHCHLIEVETPISTLRFNTSVGLVTWGGYDWLPGGGVLGIEFTQESTGAEVNKGKVTINSLNPTTTSLALRYNMNGRYIAVWHAVLNPSTYAVVDVAKLESGRISTLVLSNSENADVV